MVRRFAGPTRRASWALLALALARKMRISRLAPSPGFCNVMIMQMPRQSLNDPFPSDEPQERYSGMWSFTSASSVSPRIPQSKEPKTKPRPLDPSAELCGDP